MRKLNSLALIFLLLFACSDKGYIEVQNRSGVTMDEVFVGDNISLGSIATGANKVEETEHLGTYHVTFSSKGKRYKSKNTVKVDAKTGATFTYRDSNDVSVIE